MLITVTTMDQGKHISHMGNFAPTREYARFIAEHGTFLYRIVAHMRDNGKGNAPQIARRALDGDATALTWIKERILT